MTLIKQHKTTIAVGIIWLFHISGIIGITLGFKDWFLTKTPLNLSICLLLFVLVFPINTLKKAGLFVSFFAMGMFAEWLGVEYGLLFGNYSYGENFGPKLDGVPWLIGCFWALLACITSAMVSNFQIPLWVKGVFAASLMVILDFFMEQNAPNFDFWEFEGHVPLQNYVTWFVLALLMQLLLLTFRLEGNRTISFHLYFAQLIFFGYFVLVTV
ncbi:carotenoid biosynthesis protein [Flagellimonas meridianipacifica]|uniref:Putative membrane protein n=1 Tax=Flagellimonas meridianipacifica TaxID=1080225 RepID=A0A2T0M6X8_9FLAO|nr:carotenoid biosynthesis protein [Allomuricauda pacifica]PRX53213.1 putative membrane protein [Allomuricauda pacifica]